MNEYDAGVLNGWGGGNVGWWHDYLRCELANANQHWIEQTEQLRTELTEAKKPDCNRCRRYHRHGFGEGVCANTLIGEPACVNGDGFREADPVRLYEIDAAMAGGEHG
jgi:hypothetical protein